MADKPDANIKIVKINPSQDYAIVQDFYTDDGLFDGSQYAEWLQMQETGDRTARDYADYDISREALEAERD